MTTLSDLLGYRTALKKAFYSGVRSVTHNGTSTVFQSSADMKAALDRLEAEIAGLQSTPRPIAGLAKFSRGDNT
ncbi:hypothetical protein [Mesorhizobium sp.]|uniref:phage head-tail joining protein n=1 Tax=Mesorhizobium sp. TaxID=1871066 RepID=UPI0011F69313|nr:hypothetical protein [Mesorhizobium sp.]TIL34303.1 MAG: hypothetical protein E5Y85_11220 [Mesorhizobium sp.]